jgi:hypothetical protein
VRNVPIIGHSLLSHRPSCQGRRYGVSGGQPAEVFRQALEEAWRTRPQAPKLASIPGPGSDEIAQGGEVCGPDGTCAVRQR